MTLPSKDSFATYGGQKTDFIAVVDPTTDRSAEEVNAAFASTASMSRTAIRAMVSFVSTNDGYGPVPTKHESVWGNSLAVIPIITHAATGIYVITFPSSVTDPLGEVQSVNFQYCFANSDSTTFNSCNCSVTSPNVITVKTFDAAGNLQNNTGNLTITVFGV